jgi:microsomal dipeptidase-like Zn-dependent dipeptidase
MPSTRNLMDKQLDAIGESTWLVFNFSVCDVRPDAHLDPNTPMDTIVGHLGYLVDRMGDDHVALAIQSNANESKAIQSRANESRAIHGWRPPQSAASFESRVWVACLKLVLEARIEKVQLKKCD